MEEESQVDKLLNQYKLPIIGGTLGLVLLLGGLYYSGIPAKNFKTPTPQVKGEYAQTTMKIDISGAVSVPGVYSLPIGSRVEEAIKAAGGFAEEVNLEFVSKKLNLAQKLTDGMKIYIPFSNESGEVSADTASNSLNVNQASLADLDKLPGVGPATAQRIIDKRPYLTVEELLSKRVVSKSVYERIKISLVAS